MPTKDRDSATTRQRAQEAAPASGATHTKGRVARTEDAIVDFAQDLGRLLGSAQAKATKWMEQRQIVTKDLTRIRDAANDLLARLGQHAQAAAAIILRGESSRVARRPGRPSRAAAAPAKPAAEKATKPARRKKRRLSAETRMKMREAAKRRWAAKKGQQAS